ncbi:carboxypeptidase-like regulatory domain-containing protein [Ferruginibacter paludis]|uniref:carboxypeptidase-like regulatory domain-containing protein n=1 Tax=Ferruginibacter paludis TaxID=1310417 RepID=UPI0025B551B7|nr:carboxypeptidase-like regulatory domain-containing protein [Ferruginibacter paludis]MDN3655107.1 carboxypeptidase-like regulatory domain-containing protein [Ferruginibacter paludis]
MADNKTNIIYTAENIQQYFEGRLSPEAMHAMEKAALDDPFLADAMEGYEAMNGKEWQQQLNEAKAQIAAKENTKKATPVITVFKWWQAAAAVIVLAGGIGLAYLFNRPSTVNNENVSIADLKQKDSSEQVAVAETKSDSIAARSGSQQQRVVVIKDNPKPLIAQLKTKQVSDSNTVAMNENADEAEEKVKPGLIRDNESKEAATEDNASNMPSVAAPAAAPKAFKKESNSVAEGYNNKSLSKNNAVLRNYFSATVTAPDNTPLPFANVLVLDENVGTYADAKGRFKLAAADSILNIRVRAAGFMSQVYPIKSNIADNRIVLNEQQVAAKDIVQFKNKKLPGTMPKITMQLDTLLNVEPEDGWSNYDTYLSNNVMPDPSITVKNIHGEVEVTFDVHKDGTLSNMNISKSLCAACDVEALRVIKEGPQWKVKKGKKEKGKVKVKF